MKRFWADNALLLVLLGFFLLFWVAQALSGWAVHNQELEALRQHSLKFTPYLASAHFWPATAENWESEFLQLAAYVVLIALPAVHSEGACGPGQLPPGAVPLLFETAT